ncbi:hypothetical protein EXIGLDRAFT_817522 [Exidia glandulosa HHB12029]|uniref:DNA/RNA-binding domain-containing protein n=1 Tax=Exidia glandulosa HHB12029 TaxID=1314781 RepID=A0A165B923_EXIGL|nr:hypothetical protein EXIGLDRAFT_817522 [Exidia glandulosa HHB12029]
MLFTHIQLDDFDLLEILRRMATSSSIALEHLSDFIYYSYGFYSSLYEEPLYAPFKVHRLEALGDLARYRMTLAAHLAPSLTTAAGPEFGGHALASLPAPEPPAARIDAGSAAYEASMGARGLHTQRGELVPPTVRQGYRTRDRELRDQPANGKLHHHIAMLCREDETLQFLYHYTKSMTALHPFPTARESVLALFGPAVTSKRLLPQARTAELFVVLHGMLFTHIQLDDFDIVLARFLEKQQLDSFEEREWIMMAVTNLAAALDSGRSSGVLRKTGAFGEKKERTRFQRSTQDWPGVAGSSSVMRHVTSRASAEPDNCVRLRTGDALNPVGQTPYCGRAGG